MSVKSIFKILILTMTLLTVIPLFIEVVNVLTVGMQVKQMTKVAANQALDMFTQETYRTNSGGSVGAAKVPDIKPSGITSTLGVASDTYVNKTYISGNFYGISDTEYNSSNAIDIEKAIYKKLYKETQRGSTNTDWFDQFCTATNSGAILTAKFNVGATEINSSDKSEATVRYYIKYAPNGSTNTSMNAIFKQLNLLYSGIRNDYSNGSLYGNSEPTITWNSGVTALTQKSNREAAKSYANNRYTPVNIGIPYFDAEVTTKMFQWNLAQILSNCDDSNVQIDDNGVPFVNYNGFRCYVQHAYISEYDYYIYDTTKSSDISNLYSKTNLKPTALKKYTGSGTSADNNYVVVVGVKYKIPISYAGITPLKRIVNAVWTHDVNRTITDEEGFINGSANTNSVNVPAYWSTASEKVSSLFSNSANNSAANTVGAVQWLESGGAMDSGTNYGSYNSSSHTYTAGVDNTESGIMDTGGKLYYTLVR